MPTIFAIGYQQAAVLAAVREAGVGVLADVQAAATIWINEIAPRSA